MVDVAPDLDWALENLEFHDIEHHPVFGPLLEQLLVKRFRAKMSHRALAERFGFPLTGVRRVLRRGGAVTARPEPEPDPLVADVAPLSEPDLPELVAVSEEVPAEELIAVHVSEETVERFAQGLGDAMRSARNGRGWTRKDLRHKMGTDRSLQTLATHELGTRAMSVCQFAEYCHVLGVQPGPMFDRVYHEVFGASDDAEVTVDLDKLAASEHLNIARWARVKRSELPPSSVATLSLARHAQDTLAALCGLERAQLLEILSGA